MRLFVLATLVLTIWLLSCQYDSSARHPPVIKEAATKFVSTDPQSIYAADPKDPWNRIFHLLFTRTVRTRMTSDFPESRPFSAARQFGLARSVLVSTRTFDRFEIGDRAIEPLYPSFFNAEGVRQVLAEPNFSQLKTALLEANAETNRRPAIARALMQSDAWAAFDLLYRFLNSVRDRNRVEQLLPLFSKLVTKIALTEHEIASLPSNYEQARADLNLPDLFSRDSSWIEIQLSPDRLHDDAADFRRAARVFIHPVTATDKQAILERLRTEERPLSQLNGLVLVMQDLLVDDQGRAVPSPIIRDVQIRKFTTDANGKLASTEVQQFELSRRRLLTESAPGGMIQFTEESPSYLANAGNDYTFASTISNDGPQDRWVAVLTTLRGRCESCHGRMVGALFTLSTHEGLPLRPIAQLNPAANERASYVAARKTGREDFRALMHQ